METKAEAHLERQGFEVFPRTAAECAMGAWSLSGVSPLSFFMPMEQQEDLSRSTRGVSDFCAWPVAPNQSRPVIEALRPMLTLSPDSTSYRTGSAGQWVGGGGRGAGGTLAGLKGVFQRPPGRRALFCIFWAHAGQAG